MTVGLFIRKRDSVSPQWGRLHYEVGAHAAKLIDLANRFERRTALFRSPETTDAGDVQLARHLIAAQQDLTRALANLLVTGVGMNEIEKQLIHPVLERTVVSDLAHLVVTQVLTAAKERRGA